mmetsp:Transcript_110980/g.353582  ORF Transcript_110980/g.353582 Transcript_110980/m.353582 type:complete len:266 (+) Transcript_110980:380-1177(+)
MANQGTPGAVGTVRQAIVGAILWMDGHGVLHDVLPLSHTESLLHKVPGLVGLIGAKDQRSVVGDRGDVGAVVPEDDWQQAQTTDSHLLNPNSMMLPCTCLIMQIDKQRHADVLHIVRVVLERVEDPRQPEVEHKLEVVLVHEDEGRLDLGQPGLDPQRLAIPALQHNHLGEGRPLPRLQQVFQVALVGGVVLGTLLSHLAGLPRALLREAKAVADKNNRTTLEPGNAGEAGQHGFQHHRRRIAGYRTGGDEHGHPCRATPIAGSS